MGQNGICRETLNAVKKFYMRREARLRQRLTESGDAVEKYWILKALRNNRESERRFWAERLGKEDGGPGSGNWGHEGRPGQIGGAAPAGGGYASKQDYTAAKKAAKSKFSKQLKRIDGEAEKKIQEIKDRYGSKLRQRIEVRKDTSLTEAEREKKLAEIDEKFHKKEEELDEVYTSRAKKYDQIDKKCREVFEPDYEYDRIPEAGGGRIDDASIINPEGLLRNCQRCAVALELRHRGYDVQVSSGEGDFLGIQANIESCFIGAQIKTYSSSETFDMDSAIVSQMKEWGDGARCIITKQCEGYGHAFNLSNVSGEIFVEDAQTDWGGGWSDITSIEAGGRPNMNIEGAFQVTLIRTDNAKLSICADDYVERRG